MVTLKSHPPHSDPLNQDVEIQRLKLLELCVQNFIQICRQLDAQLIQETFRKFGEPCEPLKICLLVISMAANGIILPYRLGWICSKY